MSPSKVPYIFTSVHLYISSRELLLYSSCWFSGDSYSTLFKQRPSSSSSSRGEKKVHPAQERGEHFSSSSLLCPFGPSQDRSWGSAISLLSCCLTHKEIVKRLEGPRGICEMLLGPFTFSLPPNAGLLGRSSDRVLFFFFSNFSGKKEVDDSDMISC